MSKSASLAIISVTLTVTACLAIAMFFMNPNAGEDSIGAKVIEDAKARQSVSIVNVPEPLQTDLVVLTEEQKMAEKVSVILASDSAFVDEIGTQAVPVVGEKISDLEETYSSDMISRIEASSNDAKAYTDKAEVSAKAYADNKAEASAKAYADKAEASAKAYADEVAASNGELIQYINEKVSQEVGQNLTEDEIIRAVIGSEKFSEAVKAAMEEYHNTHPQMVITTVEKTTSRDHIAIPEFPVKDASEYSDEEYVEERSEARLNEIDRILEFLGY